MATSFQTTLQVDVTESEQSDSRAGEGAHESPPAARNIRRSLSPLLDFSGRPGSGLGDRRNFCNISECSFCKPLTDNHRLSPLRSPVISPSSRRGIFSHNCSGPKPKFYCRPAFVTKRLQNFEGPKRRLTFWKIDRISILHDGQTLSFLLFTFYNGALISVWKSVWRRKEKNLMACLFYLFSFLFRSGKLRCWTLFLTRCWQTLCGARPSFWVKACNRWIVSSPPSEK